MSYKNRITQTAKVHKTKNNVPDTTIEYIGWKIYEELEGLSMTALVFT